MLDLEKQRLKEQMLKALKGGKKKAAGPEETKG